MKKVLALDFDHTLYDTDSFLFFEIRQPMLEKWNISKDIWEQAYENAVKVGYSLEAHHSELCKLLDSEPFSLEELKDFEKNINFTKYLYSDVLPFLDEAKKRGYELVLLSFGAEDWQEKKVRGAGLHKIMDVIKYTKTEGGKKELLKKYEIDAENIIFVENNGFELDAALRLSPRLKTYFINRVIFLLEKGEMSDFMKERYSESRKIAEKSAILPHKRCQSLGEVIL